MVQELFSIQLNAEGTGWMRKLHILARALFLLSLLLSLTSLIHLFLDIRMNGLLPHHPVAALRFLLYTERLVSLVYLFIFPVQVYYFYRFSSMSVKSIDRGNSEQFSAAVRLLLVNAVLSLFT